MSGRLRRITGVALVSLAGALAVPALAGASVASPAAVTARTAANAVAAPALAPPQSPDGIHDARLCGNSSFQVFDGTFTHAFYPEGITYINGGTQHAWQEQVWWAGVVQVGGYNFVSNCYA